MRQPHPLATVMIQTVKGKRKNVCEMVSSIDSQ